MQYVATKIGELEKSLEKVKQMTQSVQEKPSERQVDLSAFQEHVKTLMHEQELLGHKLRELPR